ncbi:MAG: isochorismatase family protein [Thioalkalispiraceae bacterium]|jgi:nicotinamidase-related amidase
MATTLCKTNQSQLLLIDIQERLAGAMPKQYLEMVLSSGKTLITAATQLNIPIVHTEQYPKGLGPTHSELVSVFPDNITALEKTCFSSCGANGMEAQVTDSQRDQWIILGMETHICVLQTCMELLEKNRTVVIVEDGVCSRKKNNFKNAIARMRAAGAIISNTESVLFEWLRDASHPDFKSLSKLIR